MAVLRKPKRKPTALPFLLEAAQQRRKLLADRQNYLRDYRRNVQSTNRNSQNQLRSLDIEEPGSYRNLLNNFTGRGMAFSSGYGYNRGQVANQYANQRSNVQSNLADRLAGLRSDKQQMNSNYQYNLSNILQNQAQAAESQAGNLGYNRPKKKLKKKKSRRH